MDRAFSTLAHQSGFAPTILFRGPESVSYELGERSFSNIAEERSEGLRHDDDEDHEDQLLELMELPHRVYSAS